MMNKKIFEINNSIITIEIADSFCSRFRGLMFRRNLDKGHGLLITPCNSVHMMFMRFAIDVIYLDKNYTIKKIVHNLRPWLGVSMCLGAHSTLELNSGEAKILHLQIGQTLYTVKNY